jgi:hypothetical protein
MNSSKRARGANVYGEIIRIKFYLCPRIFKSVRYGPILTQALEGIRSAGAVKVRTLSREFAGVTSITLEILAVCAGLKDA